MNQYVKRIDQLMQVRFEFRKNQRKKYTNYEGGVIPPEARGNIYVVLTIGTTYNEKTRLETGLKYGPFATPAQTTKGIWEKRHSMRLTGIQKTQAQDLNRQLATIQDQLEAVYTKLVYKLSEEQSGLVIDGPMVIEYWKKGKSFAPVTLAEVYEQFLDWKKSMIEPNRKKRKPEQISEGTFKTYRKRWVLIQQFLHKRGESRIPVGNVEFATATDLKEWMVKQKSGKPNGKTYDTATISKVIKLLKMLLTYAQSKRYVRHNVLATFSMPAGSPADPKPLTSEQMNQLETADLPPVLRHQCDSWLVAAELCLHYADFMELPRIDFVYSESGKLFIQHDRAKQSGTKLIQTVNVTPRALRLLEKYNGPRGLFYGSNAYWSKQLKSIARLADLRDAKTGEIIKLQFGQGRDTGLTQRAIDGANGIQLSRVAGWAKIGQSERYVGNPIAIVEEFANGIKVPPKPRTDNPFSHIYKAS